MIKNHSKIAREGSFQGKMKLEDFVIKDFPKANHKYLFALKVVSERNKIDSKQLMTLLKGERFLVKQKLFHYQLLREFKDLIAMLDLIEDKLVNEVSSGKVSIHIKKSA